MTLQHQLSLQETIQKWLDSISENGHDYNGYFADTVAERMRIAAQAVFDINFESSQYTKIELT